MFTNLLECLYECSIILVQFRMVYMTTQTILYTFVNTFLRVMSEKMCQKVGPIIDVDKSYLGDAPFIDASRCNPDHYRRYMLAHAGQSAQQVV